MDKKLIHIIQQLYHKASSAIMLQAIIGKWFPHISWCMLWLSSILYTFDIFFEHIKTATLEKEQFQSQYWRLHYKPSICGQYS